MFQVAIVHGLADFRLGNAIRRELEQSGVVCWFAARDLKASDGTVAGHEDAIGQAQVVVAVVPVDRAPPEPIVAEALDAARRGASVVPVFADVDPDGADDAFALSLRRIRAAAAVFAPPSGLVPPLPPRVRGRSRRRRAFLGALGLAGVALVAGGAWWSLPGIGVLVAARSAPVPTASASAASGVPMRISGGHARDSWNMVVQLRERARRIEYRVDGQGAFVSTGLASAPANLDSTTPDANIYWELPELTHPVTLEIRYVNLEGIAKGPFSQRFDPVAELCREARERLEPPLADWVSVRPYDKARILYFSALLGSKSGIRSIRYGIDSDRATEQLFFVPDLQNRSFNNEKGYLYLPKTARTLAVEVELKDGSILKRQFQLAAVTRD